MPSIQVVDYDRNWPTFFEKEKARVLSVAREYIDDIQHVGSTSVPGLGAKPIIDILVGLREIFLVGKCVQAFQDLGYEYFGENGIPGRHFFRYPPGASWTARNYNMHAVEKEGDEWKKLLLFRDYLRTHLEDAHQYEELKRELAAKYDSDFEAYTVAKAPFIEAILVKAALGEKI